MAGLSLCRYCSVRRTGSSCCHNGVVILTWFKRQQNYQIATHQTSFSKLKCNKIRFRPGELAHDAPTHLSRLGRGHPFPLPISLDLNAFSAATTSSFSTNLAKSAAKRLSLIRFCRRFAAFVLSVGDIQRDLPRQ